MKKKIAQLVLVFFCKYKMLMKNAFNNAITL